MKREFASLNARLEMEQAMPKEEVVKRSVGRPKKDKGVVLYKPSLEPMKKSRCKTRKKYFNWFTPQQRPPIFRVVQQHHSIGDAWSFLRSTYRLLGDLSNVYDHLSRDIMYGWFHTNGTLEGNIQRCVELRTYFIKSTQHCLILDKFRLLKEKICETLKLLVNSYTQVLHKDLSKQSFPREI